MADIDARSGTVLPTAGMLQLTHVIYGLHAFSALMGLLGSAFVVTTFLTGWPSLIAVVLNYLYRPNTRGTLIESHFIWQIRTFWFALLWVVIALLMVLTVIGIPFAWVLVVIIGLWVLYRIGRGWLALAGGRTMPVD